jgi:hypothetical protein
MPGTPLHALVAATALTLASCAHPAPFAKEAAMQNASTTSSAVNPMPVRQWPLRFKSHSFGAFCYDTLTCKIRYANLEHGSDKPSPPSSTYGPKYLDHLSGGHGMIRNFPSPARVSWRSKDGQSHEAEIDIGEIFQDELIRHNVSREEMADVPDGEYQNEPSIILEVNDRTIRVWMRAHIPTKELQKPGNPYSDFRNDLILAKAYTY